MGVASNVHKQEKVTYEKQLNVICQNLFEKSYLERYGD